MRGFFNVVDRERFLKLLATFPPLTERETVPLSAAHDRILADDLAAPEDLPLTTRSCMDGFAVRAADTFGASESNPHYLECSLELAVDEASPTAVAPGSCARIPTGGSLPQGTDAVVMVEHTAELDGGTVEIRRPVAPGDNTMQPGEDVACGTTALNAGTRLRAGEIGLLAALGIGQADVFVRPRVAVISTGDELTTIDAPARPGKVRDVNSTTVALLAKRAGAEPVTASIVPDDLDTLTDTLAQALNDCDAVLLSGGSSVGVRDLTMDALEAVGGVDILAHGVTMSPGKPTILAARDQKPLLGLPGQVASALVVMRVLGIPLLRHLCGDPEALSPLSLPVRRAVLARNLASRPGREDFVRVRLEHRPGKLPLAHPVPGPSGLARTLIGAHGLAVIPTGDEGRDQGKEIDVISL